MIPKFKNRAACDGTDTEMWFLEQDFSYNYLLKRICSTCPARVECFDYALHNNVIGFWAGTTYQQRKQIRRENNITAKSITPELELKRA
jgi:hypothetical protein